jgi:hypothetical protein
VSFPFHTTFEQTPPFLTWTLVHTCALREFTEPTPAVTERLLRGVRCYSEAVLEQRVINNLVLEPHWQQKTVPMGFEIPAVLEPLGGCHFIEQQCRQCPANAMQQRHAHALAGCVGFFAPRANDLASFHNYMNSLLPHAVSQQAWYGFALTDYTQPAQLLEIAQRLTHLQQHNGEAWLYGLNDFHAAISIAIEKKRALLVLPHAAGVCSGRKWEVAAYCGHCTAPWPQEKWQHCENCGGLGHRQATRIRKRMGTRPYRPITEFLTAEAIAQLHETT